MGYSAESMAQEALSKLKAELAARAGATAKQQDVKRRLLALIAKQGIKALDKVEEAKRLCAIYESCEKEASKKAVRKAGPKKLCGGDPAPRIVRVGRGFKNLARPG